MAQELLTTFSAEINELSLQPSDSGVFRVIVNDVTVWERKEMDGFPEIKILKQKVRDVIAPDKTIGHSDRKR